MTRPRVALIHSPLVGPATWRGAAQGLRALGYPRVETPDASAWEVEPPYYGGLASRITAGLDGGPWVVVGHSGAGGLLPAIAEALPGGAGMMIFVDAVLPHPGKAWVDTAPPALSPMLRERAKGGFAPAWPDWFPAGVLGRLLPNREVRAAFEGEARPVPMAYLEERAPATANAQASRGYLQLSQGYEAEADAAAAAGWTVAREALHHLAMITEPDKVAAALHRLIEALSVSLRKPSHER
jgi:hypothetical protein